MKKFLILAFFLAATSVHAFDLGGIVKKPSMPSASPAGGQVTPTQQSPASSKKLEIQSYLRQKYSLANDGQGVNDTGDIKGLAAYISQKYGAAVWTGQDKTFPEWLIKTSDPQFCLYMTYAKQNVGDNFIMGNMSISRCDLDKYKRVGLTPQ